MGAALLYALTPSKPEKHLRAAPAQIRVRDPPARVQPDDLPLADLRDCPDVKQYCDDACAGRPIPIMGQLGCPVPRCLCPQIHAAPRPVAVKVDDADAPAAVSARASAASASAADPNAAPMVARAPASRPLPAGSIYALSATANDGSAVDFRARFRGKVTLLVNVASK